MVVAYRADRLIDGISEELRENAAVLVEDGRIVSVCPNRELAGNTETVDLGNMTLMPGLIDAHVHLVWSASAEPHSLVESEPRAVTALRCAANMQKHLDAGITTVRDVGSTDGMAIDIAQAVQLGVLPGPRVIAAGRAIAMTGGHGWFLGQEADGPDSVRSAVRQEIKNGATCIKFMASGGVYGHAEEPGSPQLTVAEMRAGVEEAHKAGKKVAAHAYSAEAINNALEAGVDSIEHGSFIDQKTAEKMRDQQAYLVPTMSVYAAMDERGPELGAPEYVQRKTKEVLTATQEALRTAMEAGVKIAAGTDCGAPGHPHGTLQMELRLMAEAGATPMQAIQSGTSAAAELLGLEAEIGTLEVGKSADLVAIGGNPLEDITDLEKVELVVLRGEAVNRASL